MISIRFNSLIFLLFVGLALSGCHRGQDADTRTADDVDEEEDASDDGDGDQRTPSSDVRSQNDEAVDAEADDASTGNVTIPDADAPPQSNIPPRPEPNSRAQRDIERGLQFVASNNLEGARDAFEEALRGDDRAYQAAFNLGVVLERLGQDQQARESYRRSVEIQPDYERAIEAQARMDSREGRAERALSFVEQRARQFPTNMALQVIYADILVQVRRYRDAMQVARQILRREERNIRAMLVFAKSNYHLGRYDLALWILDQAAEIDGSNAEIYNVRGFVHLAQDQRLLAIEDFERAVQLRTDYAEARNNLGVQYLISGRYLQAVEQLEAARQLSPNWTDVYLNIGDAYRGAQNWTKAKASLEKALRLDSERPEGYYNLGVLYLAATKIEGMDRVTQLQKSIESFQRYKNMSASRLKSDDPVNRLVQDAQRALEREQTRIERDRAAAEEEASRNAARDPSGGDAGSGDDVQWEDGGAGGGDSQTEDEDIQWE